MPINLYIPPVNAQSLTGAFKSNFLLPAEKIRSSIASPGNLNSTLVQHQESLSRFRCRTAVFRRTHMLNEYTYSDKTGNEPVHVEDEFSRLLNQISDVRSVLRSCLLRLFGSWDRLAINRIMESKVVKHILKIQHEAEKSITCPHPFSVDNPLFQSFLSTLPNEELRDYILHSTFHTFRDSRLTWMDENIDSTRGKRESMGTVLHPPFVHKQTFHEELDDFPYAASRGLTHSTGQSSGSEPNPLDSLRYEIHVYHPKKPFIQQKIIATGETTLEELRDMIHCTVDEVFLRNSSYAEKLFVLERLLDSKLCDINQVSRRLRDLKSSVLATNPSFLYFEGHLYDDTRKCHACRITNELDEDCGCSVKLSTSVAFWSLELLSKGINHGWGTLQSGEMRDAKLKDLQLRVGAHYSFIHCYGKCQHLIVVQDMTLLNEIQLSEDRLLLSSVSIQVPMDAKYPLIVWKANGVKESCVVCMDPVVHKVVFPKSLFDPNLFYTQIPYRNDSQRAVYCKDCFCEWYGHSAMENPVPKSTEIKVFVTSLPGNLLCMNFVPDTV